MRSSAAGTPSGFALAGICRRSSARNGSSSEISISSLRRQISISTSLFERGEQGIAEDALENHGHIAHQIHGIVVHDHLPWKVKFFFRTSLFLDGGLINCRRSRIFPNMERGDRCAFIHRHLLAKVAPHSYSKRLTYVTFSSNVWMRLRSSISTS